MRGISEYFKSLRSNQPFLYRTLVALFLAIVTLLITQSTRDILLFGKHEESSFDLAISLQADREGIAEAAPPVLFIDVDLRSYLYLGRPLVMPRHRLAELLNFVLEGEPGAVLIDIDLAHRAPASEEDKLRGALLDAAGRNIPVLLSRSLIPFDTAPSALRLPATSFDDIVGRENALHWVSVRHMVDGDGMVRRMPTMVPYCGSDNTVDLLPSAPLFLAGILGRESGIAETVEKSVKMGGSCDQSNTRKNNALSRILGWDSADGEYRIFYHMSWPQRSGKLRPMVPLHGVPDQSAPVLETLPALPIWRLPPGASMATDIIRGRIVIIGASHPESEDFHLTPLGRMPGAVVLANAVRSYISFGPLETLSFGLKILIVIGATLLTAFLFWLNNRLGIHRPVLTKYFAMALMTGIWFALSWRLLVEGIWIDFLIPQFVVATYFFASEYHAVRDRLAAVLIGSDLSTQPQEKKL